MAMTIDHDVLMMIYGALIGVVSSIATSLFQSWLNRREHERQRKEEEKRARQKIQIPTTEEVRAINLDRLARSVSYRAPNISDAQRKIKSLENTFSGFSIAILALLCVGGYYYLEWLGGHPNWYIGISAFLAVWIIYIIIYFVRALQEETTRPTSHDQ